MGKDKLEIQVFLVEANNDLDYHLANMKDRIDLVDPNYVVVWRNRNSS